MNREHLSHLLRAAARITGDSEVLVLGSQAILGTYAEEVLPGAALRSVEADLAFRHDPEERKSDQVDGAIGELSMFHQEFGYYGQGVSIATAVLPSGWEERLVPFDAPDHPGAVCLEAHDLVIAKLVAGREKDFEFAVALLARGLVEVKTLLARVALLEDPRAVKKRVTESVEQCALEARTHRD